MLRELFHRLRAQLRREMNAEMRYQVVMEIAENMRRG